MFDYVDRIIKVLDERGLDGKKIAEMTDLSPQSISSWKQHKSSPSGDSLVKIIKYLNDIDARWLLTGEKQGYQMNNLISSNRNYIQNESKLTIREPEESIWKLKYDHAMEIISEKNKQIELLKSLIK
jgi:transcriptional regulator with XRE-family HTH domain